MQIAESSSYLSAPLEDGGVQVIRDGDTIYLSSQKGGAAANADGTILNSSPSGEATTSGEHVFTNTQIDLPTGFASDVGNLLNSVLSLVMVIATLLVFLYLIWGAFDWITSGGDRSKTAQARQKIVAAIVGLIIIAASFAVLQLMLRFLGFEGFNDALGSLRTIS